MTPRRRRTASLVAGAIILVLVCGGAGVAIGAATRSDEPALKLGEEASDEVPPIKQRTEAKDSRLGDHWEQAEAVYSVGKGVKVSVTGGGAGTSECTRDETVETFTTAGDDEKHPFGFVARDGGSCYIYYSSSHFFLKFTGPDGKQLGKGRMFFSGPMVGVGYYASCLNDAEWEGINCEKAGQRTLRITRAG